MELPRSKLILICRVDATFNGIPTYTLQYKQLPIILSVDQDGDSILTGHELGGYDPDEDGVSNGIFASYGASPFMKVVI